MKKFALITMTLACVIAGCESKPLFGKKEPEFKQEYSEFTIMLASYKGPHHVRFASSTKRELEAQNWKDVFAVHKDDYSAVYSGRYATPKDAAKDLIKAKSFMLANGRRPFEKAIIVAMPGSTQDAGPDKWNLKNADGRYSLLVAIFFDVPESNYFGRRQRAVEVCKKLRKQGEEAYFFHGPNKSGVSLGCFGPDAIKEQTWDIKHPKTGKFFKEKRHYINDPKLRALRHKYPELVICGNTEIDTKMEIRDGKVVTVKEVQQSYPIGIPGWKEKHPDRNDGRQNQNVGRPRVGREDYIGYP